LKQKVPVNPKEKFKKRTCRTKQDEIEMLPITWSTGRLSREEGRTIMIIEAGLLVTTTEECSSS